MITRTGEGTGFSSPARYRRCGLSGLDRGNSPDMVRFTLDYLEAHGKLACASLSVIQYKSLWLQMLNLKEEVANGGMSQSPLPDER